MAEVTRVVADSDVLTADLLVGGTARQALDIVRSHSWIDLVASDPLLTDTREIIAELSSTTLATEWYETIESERCAVDHPPEDHPALASAHNGNAAHVLSFDDHLGSADAGITIRKRVKTSVKHPDAFVTLFDPEQLHETLFDEPYPGPDCSLS